MVVGFVSGTGAGLVEAFVGSPRFEFSCALLVAVALVFVNEPCNVSRSDLAEASGRSAEEVTFSTESDAGLMKKESEFNPPIHPRQMATARADSGHVRA